jgi:hypothetical protein
LRGNSTLEAVEEYEITEVGRLLDGVPQPIGFLPGNRDLADKASLYFAYSSAAIAKFRFWESLSMKVVMPRRLPWASNRPPPEEP